MFTIMKYGILLMIYNISSKIFFITYSITNSNHISDFIKSNKIKKRFFF